MSFTSLFHKILDNLNMGKKLLKVKLYFLLAYCVFGYFFPVQRHMHIQNPRMPINSKNTLRGLICSWSSDLVSYGHLFFFVGLQLITKNKNVIWAEVNTIQYHLVYITPIPKEWRHCKNVKNKQNAMIWKSNKAILQIYKCVPYPCIQRTRLKINMGCTGLRALQAGLH